MAQIGPVLPPGWKPEGASNTEETSSDDETTKSQEPQEEADPYGPALPPDLLEPSATASAPNLDEDDGVDIGPVPASTSSDADDYDYRLNAFMRQKAEEEELKQRKRKREEWMTELPSKLSKGYGLTARTFKKHGYSDGDPSAWTETPEERQHRQLNPEEEKSKDEKALLNKAAAERDRQYDLEVARLAEKRAKESLVELHQKKQKKEKDEAAEKGLKAERRPFDREKDLKIVNLASADDRRATLDKASQLGSRFGHGSGKYL